MSGLRRPTPAKHILELSRRLAEDYDSIPLREVSRVVTDAAHVSGSDPEWNGTAEGIAPIVDVIEVVAREELDALRAAETPASS